MQKANVMSSSIPEGKLARTGVAGVAALKIGVRSMTHRTKRPFMSKQKQQEDKASLDEENAKTLFKALTQLRGTALKVAQMVGMDQGFLPESYRKELEKSFHKVPPLNRVLVNKVIHNELNDSAKNLFTDFNNTAFAAASLGQVHKAKLPNNHQESSKEIAVKIQYPGIDRAIKSDMTMIRGVARGMHHTHHILQSIDEIEARLTEEVDYRTEAKNTLWFKEKIQMEGITIPNVYQELSSRRILSTEFIEGLHLDDWLATNPSQALRNLAAQRLYDFFIFSSKNLQCLHADPNIGNYLFHEDASITVIDFGCVRRLSDTFTHVFPQLVKAYLNDSPEDLKVAYNAIGMTFENFDDTLYQEVLRPFGQWVTAPFKENSFDFTKHFDYTQQGKEPMKQLHELANVDRIAEEFIFHNRTIYGLCQIFERMGVEVNIRHHWNLD